MISKYASSSDLSGWRGGAGKGQRSPATYHTHFSFTSTPNDEQLLDPGNPQTSLHPEAELCRGITQALESEVLEFPI